MKTKLIEFYKKKSLDFLITVNGNCMLPLIKDKELIKIIQSDNYNISDIILCRFEDMFYLHRVIEIIYVDGEEQFITKGDSNLETDAPSIKPNIYGKAVYNISTNEYIC